MNFKDDKPYIVEFSTKYWDVTVQIISIAPYLIDGVYFQVLEKHLKKDIAYADPCTGSLIEESDVTDQVLDYCNTILLKD